MSVYGELAPMVEHRTQFAFKVKREHISKVNMPNSAYPSQHIDIELPHGSRGHVVVPDTVKITFNLDITSTDKARSVVNNVGRALVKKKVLMLGSEDIDTISNSNIYDMYKDLYLSEKYCEEKLLQGIETTNGLTLFRMRGGGGGKKASPTSFSPIISTNLGINPQNFLTFSFNPFSTVV